MLRIDGGDIPSNGLSITDRLPDAPKMVCLPAHPKPNHNSIMQSLQIRGYAGLWRQPKCYPTQAAMSCEAQASHSSLTICFVAVSKPAGGM